ncbi:MAG: polyphosphate polymerase domain-containing protein [Firmicutes bacterium]|nr:polyphosphate polymerase domain-containing protein [Bacillota bacterium]
MESIFKRQEVKFVLTQAHFLLIYQIITQHVPPDRFGKYLVQSIYFDTDNWDVIRASIEKPVYKEKLRLRCYGVPGANSPIYLELKKKYKGMVHKRRIDFLMDDLKNKTPRDIAAADNSQVGKELDFYLKSMSVYEKAHISYNREAFSDTNGLRVTFDTDIRFRTNFLDYGHPSGGLEVLPEGYTIMEVKTLGGMPLWLAHALSQFRIFPTSFSKYGTGYKKYILQRGDLWTFLPKAL